MADCSCITDMLVSNNTYVPDHISAHENETRVLFPDHTCTHTLVLFPDHISAHENETRVLFPDHTSTHTLVLFPDHTSTDK